MIVICGTEVSEILEMFQACWMWETEMLNSGINVLEEKELIRREKRREKRRLRSPKVST